MKQRLNQLFTLAVAGLLATSLAMPVRAEKMPTDPLGGKPPAGSKVSVEDLDAQVKYQRAFEAVIWSMPAVAKYGMHRASVEIGAGNNVVMAWSGGAKPLLETLTPNNTTPYVTSTTDLRKGPVVVEVPKATDKANLFGQIADNWYITIADIGPIGVDKGKGGKILLTPPGYKDKVPTGYIEVKSPNYIVDFAFRSIPTPNGTPEDAYALSKSIKMYYLSELPNPKPTKIVDPIDTRWSTLARYDERWFEDLHEIISVEPVRKRDKVMMGMLKHIGIEKGKPFNPDKMTKAIFRRAAIDAYYYMQQRYLTVEPDELYWADRRWRNVFYSDANMGFSWDLDDMLDYDNRSVHPWFTAIYFPNKVTKRPPTMYLATARDKDGKLFQAGKTYALTVPEDVPINKFWSLTVYDMETWAFIYTKEERPGLSSREIPKMKKNADGSVTLYVGPKAPKGLKNNWIPTAGKTPYLMFRFYGPKDAFYDKTFKLADVELVK
jgi:hypothetical protein